MEIYEEKQKGISEITLSVLEKFNKVLEKKGISAEESKSNKKSTRECEQEFVEVPYGDEAGRIEIETIRLGAKIRASKIEIPLSMGMKHAIVTSGPGDENAHTFWRIALLRESEGYRLPRAGCRR